MKRTVALAVLSILALTACKDSTRTQLEQQQKQTEVLQQQLVQQDDGQQDNTVYQLTPEGIKNIIPAEAQANGSNGQPVAGTDGQQYIYDQPNGSWLPQSLINTAAGTFIDNALANKFTQARNQNSPIAQHMYISHYQSARPNRKATQQLNTRSLPTRNRAAATPDCYQTTRVQPNYRRPAMRGGLGHRR